MLIERGEVARLAPLLARGLCQQVAFTRETYLQND